MSKKKKIEELKEIAVEARKAGVPPSVLLEGEQACFLEAKGTYSSPGGKADKMLDCTKEKWKQSIKEQKK